MRVASEQIEDELLSLVVMKRGRKVVCGSQEGVLDIFSWDEFGDVSDRFPGHPNSVDALLKIDEDTIVTGSSDGLIRCVIEGLMAAKAVGVSLCACLLGLSVCVSGRVELNWEK